MDYSQLHNIARYMDSRGRIYRQRPVTGIPLAERYSQAERLTDVVWELLREIGINPGPRPTLIATGQPLSPPTTLSHRLAALEVETHCTVVMCGLYNAQRDSVYALLKRTPGDPLPNFRKIIDDAYGENEENE